MATPLTPGPSQASNISGSSPHDLPAEHAPMPVHPLTEKEVQEKPWKYIGYKVFSRWISSDQDLFVFRRFDTLNARIILGLQWELTVLENKLHTLDEELSKSDTPDIDNGSFEIDHPQRGELIKEIQYKLRNYSQWIQFTISQT